MAFFSLPLRIPLVVYFTLSYNVLYLYFYLFNFLEKILFPICLTSCNQTRSCQVAFYIYSGLWYLTFGWQRVTYPYPFLLASLNRNNKIRFCQSSTDH